MMDDLFIIIIIIVACPPGSFFYNGSCYFYLPPKQLDEMKGIGFSDVSVDEGTEFYLVEYNQLKSKGSLN